MDLNENKTFAEEIGTPESTIKKEGHFKTKQLQRRDIKRLEKIADFPSNALVEISNGCNHQCLFCYNTLMQRKVGKLDMKTYEYFLKSTTSKGLKEIGLYSTGEPFINKDLHLYIRLAKKYGLEYIYATSNGALANPDYVEKCIQEGLSSIKFSVNASDRETYKSIHGKDDWDSVLDNIRSINKLKLNKYQNFKLLGSCVMTTITGDIREQHKKIFGGIFEDTMYHWADNQAGRNAEYVEKISPKLTKTPLNQIKPCEMLWSRYHLTCEGFLTCCCVDYEHDLVFGDINKKNPLEEWNNDLIQSLRYKHLTKNIQGTICFNCLTGEKEEYSAISNLGFNNISMNKLNKRKFEEYKQRLDEEITKNKQLKK